ncbi:MAG: hypothetical protein JWP06_347 [Candidatus Saccharibacteria bacterium]|nr:hypothetical protein [Candidatus Saccharibacteria bacterium]
MNAELGPNFEPSRRDFLRLALGLSGAVALGMMTGCDTMPDTTGEVQQPKGNFETKTSWEQDFSTLQDGPIDQTIWTYETDPVVPGYNQEEQGYTKNRENVRIEGGRLIIEAHREPYTYPDDPAHHYEITSGWIDTRDSFTFEYGKIEARLKLPEGKGTWPAFWMLSANNPYTSNVKWNESDERFYMHDGELDILEAYGNSPGQIEATVHTHAKSQEKRIMLPDSEDGFHTYGVEVTPTGIVWTLDGTPYYEVRKPSENPDEWPFGNGNKFYAILNLAMGGSGGGKIDSAMDTWRMEVESIKFYDFTDPR